MVRHAGALFIGEGGDGREHAQVEVNALDVEFARLDFGKIEDVVDQAKKDLAGPLNARDIVALLAAEFGLEQQPLYPYSAALGRGDKSLGFTE